jgi:hypothetical protein
MTMALILPISVAVVAFFARAQEQIEPPADGYQLSSGEPGDSIIIPMSVAQCEPFFIFYNLTTASSPFNYIYFFMDGGTFLTLTVPSNAGYLEWICNIPVGEKFYAGGLLYTVQPGSSSACLGDLTTTYSLAVYNTTGSFFQSYTASTSLYPVSVSASASASPAVSSRIRPLSLTYALVCFIIL